MAEFDDIRQLIGELLHLGDQVKKWHPDTALVGSIPEFDSMAVVALIQALEERFGIQISDDEISAETFETIGRVYELVLSKTGGPEHQKSPVGFGQSFQQEGQRLTTASLICPYCGSDHLIKYGVTPNGKQRYRCGRCGRQHREHRNAAFSAAVEHEAIKSLGLP
jgi:acyl carrier protein